MPRFMNTLKPPKLKRGDVIGIVAPSSPPRTIESVEKGISYLEKLGYRVEVSQNIFTRNGYLAGTDDERVSEFNKMFSKKDVKAIFVARGGYGLHRILSKINYALVKRNPKIVVGYSDVTALQLALWKKCKLVSLSAPLVVEFVDKLVGEKEEMFWQLLTSTKVKNISYPVIAKTVATKQSHRTSTSLSVTKGILLGGNLTLLSTLCGTPYFPSFDKSIFFCEDVDEAPYRIDRMFHHLKLANVFKNTKGIVLGDFTGCARKDENSLSMQQVFDDAFSDVNAPLFSQLKYGHTKETFPIPLGIIAELHAKKNEMRLLESIVE